MNKIAIKAENLSKAYQLGEFSTGTISRDIERWWHKISGKEDPYLKIGEINDRTTKGNTDVVWSLKDLNFEINQGDAVGIIGRNGAGKSTLLKILSRVTAPTTGGVKIRGRIASLLEVGTGFHPELTGRENIYLNGVILGMRKKEIKRKFEEIVDFAGVERYIDTPVKRYSSGMYVRLAFAVAAYLESEILIVDEVLAVGDAEFQTKCLRRMENVSVSEGRTILFVSHNIGMIRQLCEKSILLDNGSIVVKGNTENVISEYLNNNSNDFIDYVDIENHPGRLKGMNKILKRTSLLNQDSIITNIFTQNEIINLSIRYESNLPYPVSGVGFILYNYENIRVGGGNTYMFFQPPHKIPNSGLINFKIPAKQLTPGIYKASVSIGSHQGILVDKVEHCINFTIQQYDIYGTGYLLTQEDGVVALKFSCNIEI